MNLISIKSDEKITDEKDAGCVSTTFIPSANRRPGSYLRSTEASESLDPEGFYRLPRLLS